MTAPLPVNPIVVGLAGLPAGRSDEALLNLLTPEGRQAVIVAALAAHAQKINDLEVKMAELRDAYNTMAGAVDEAVGELNALATRVDELEGETGPVAADLRSLAERLSGAYTPAPGGGDEPPPAPGDDPVPAPVDDQGNPVDPNA